MNDALHQRVAKSMHRELVIGYIEGLRARVADPIAESEIAQPIVKDALEMAWPDVDPVTVAIVAPELPPIYEDESNRKEEIEKITALLKREIPYSVE